MRQLTQVYDLIELPGIVGYVEGILQTDMRAAFAKNGVIQPFGVALGEVVNGQKLLRPQPMVTGGGGAMSMRNTKRTLRTLTLNSSAKGVIFCYQATDPDAVVIIQLEHKVHGDLVWSARIVGGQLGDFTGGESLASCSLAAVKPSCFMQQRYMQ